MNTLNHDFLARGGEMGALTRAKDWSKTPIGAVELWPQSLRTTLGILLNSKFPMFLFWGPDHICFYNDAYRPSLGNDGKHPAILGQKGAEYWPEIWDFIAPLIDQVLTEGEATWHENQLLPIYRNGKMEDVYWTFSYSPVNNDDGKIAGVLVICDETTEKVKLVQNLETVNTRYRDNILQTPNAMCIFRGKDYVVEIANELMLEIWERKIDQVLNRPIFEALPEVTGQGLEDVLLNVYTTGERFTAYELPVKLTRKGKVENTFINVVYEALKEPDGTISGIVAIANDVTMQVIARNVVEESDKRFRDTVKQLPLGIAILKGADLIVEMANPTYLQIVDKTEDEVLNKPVFKPVPEAKDAVYPLLAKVYEDGIPYYTDELQVTINRHGKQETCYFNLVFHPLKDENDSIEGVIIVTYEVTEAVNARYLLTESERAFRNLVMDSPIAMAIFRGKDHIIEMANNAMMKTIWQRKEEETIGKPLLEIFPELLEQKYSELLDQVVLNKKIVRENESLAYVNIKGELVRFYFDYQYTPLLEKDGNASGVMVTVNDVTSKVEARKKVENAEERARLAAEIAEIATWDLNVPNQELIYSENLPTIFGHDKALQLTRPDLHRQIHPDDKNILKEAFQTAIKTGIYKYESRIIKPDDSVSWIRAHGKIFHDEDKNPVKMLGTIMDITDEKNNQQVLMESEAKFRLLADSMPQHIWTGDAMGNLNYFNESVFTYSGISVEDIIKKGWLQIVHPDDREANVNTWTEAVKTGNDFLLEHRFRRHDGTYRWHFGRAVPLRDANGEIIRWFGTCTDIEDQKRAAAEIKSLNEDLEDRVRRRTAQVALANDELAGARARLQSVLDAATQVSIIATDTQGVIRLFNSGAEKMLKYEADEVIGICTPEMIHLSNEVHRQSVALTRQFG
ncbi:MAG: PAS domain S-box protein, partial [Flavobacterium sp.]